MCALRMLWNKFIFILCVTNERFIVENSNGSDLFDFSLFIAYPDSFMNASRSIDVAILSVSPAYDDMRNLADAKIARDSSDV